MLDPSPFPEEALPSAFLPHLPRSQATLEPLAVPDILGHIALLRELYVPPIHGGFLEADIRGLDNEDEGPLCSGTAKERRFSAGLADTMDGLGLVVGSLSASTRISEPSSEPDDEEDEYEDWSTDGEEEGSTAHLEPFERDWAERWLNGVVRRAQGWLEDREGLGYVPDLDLNGDVKVKTMEMEAVLRDATAVLAMMAGTSAAGSLTRHLLFPVDPSLATALRASHHARPANPDLSPETTTFLASLSMSPVSPMVPFLRRPNPSLSPEVLGANMHRSSNTGHSQASYPSSSPESTFSSSRRGRRRKRRPAIPILLHDAPMADHLSVGVQTWGSAILLGREIALHPDKFGLFPAGKGVRVLELGAGTGLLSILCQKLLDLRQASTGLPGPSPGLIVATDFHADVLSNLKVCVDLNFPSHMSETLMTSSSTMNGFVDAGLRIAKLDWSAFPALMEAKRSRECAKADHEGVDRLLEQPFDIVLASDCVYDHTHAAMLRQVAGWVLRTPTSGVNGDVGGTMHILSPLRPTFAPELESVDQHFPLLSSYPALSSRRHPTNTDDSSKLESSGEGFVAEMGLKLGVRGEGKRPMRGKKGEGRTDETSGYWWWEIGWG